ncbi:MAG: FtsW/RodA/SpoVE family cell cycle protein, partial [Rhodocyclaceae bacterium]|nr:FtsW/RodA/SpoVE family cell cycle protein [Rhodocyclaceae bacterium]
MTAAALRRHGSGRGAQPQELDALLLWPALTLLLFGMVMVYSASIATAEGSRFTAYQPAYFLIRHGVFLAIGLIAAAVVFQVPLRVWQQAAPWLFLVGVALLVLVLVPFLGREVNGARRWLPLGLVNLQPSELMKLFAVLYAADYTVRKL